MASASTTRTRSGCQDGCPAGCRRRVLPGAYARPARFREETVVYERSSLCRGAGVLLSQGHRAETARIPRIECSSPNVARGMDPWRCVDVDTLAILPARGSLESIVARGLVHDSDHVVTARGERGGDDLALASSDGGARRKVLVQQQDADQGGAVYRRPSLRESRPRLASRPALKRSTRPPLMIETVDASGGRDD